jgi:hypothetical protein
MSLKLVSDSNNVVSFPPERRLAPTVEMVREMAPTPALVASILEERALSLPDVRSAFRSQTAQQASLLEGWLGREGTVLQLRALLDAQLAQAAEACRRYLEAADAMVRLEVRAEAIGRKRPWLAGTLHNEIAGARTAFRDQAIAARGAADAALGVAEALADYVRSEPGMPVDSEQLVLPLLAPSAASA